MAMARRVGRTHSLASSIDGSMDVEDVFAHEIAQRRCINRQSSIRPSSLSDCQRESTSSSGERLTQRVGRELRYFFMNPCQKYKAKKRKPFKLATQVVKIALVTVQLIVYGTINQDIVEFMSSSKQVLEKSLLSLRTDDPYLYKQDGVYFYLNSLRQEYVKIPNSTIGFYAFHDLGYNVSMCRNESLFEPVVNDNGIAPIRMCVTEYTLKDSDKPKSLQSYDLSKSRTTCMVLKDWNLKEPSQNQMLNNKSIPLCDGSLYKFDFTGLISVQLDFGFYTKWMKQSDSQFSRYHGKCFNIYVWVLFDNKAHSGRLQQSLGANFNLTRCRPPDDSRLTPDVAMVILDCVIVLVCSLSTILCARSLWRAQRLRQSFERFYSKRYDKRLTCQDKMEFINAWHFLIIISDILTIIGSLLKLCKMNLMTEGIINYDACSLFLGLGALCVWVGVLRYLGYFHQYNILVLTMKLAMPHVLRFMVCASMLYFGFMFCGWVVLGPYHHKFRNPIVTSEALFSLINGDDMYMTYEEIEKSSMLAWVFSQIYLYTFISLFIYIVLSLFIAVIMETYEMIKDWQRDGVPPPQTEVHKFIEEFAGGDEDYDNFLRSDTYCCICCYHNTDPDISTDTDDGDNDDDLSDVEQLIVATA